MIHIFNMLKQQINGTINIAVPWFIVFCIFPSLFFSSFGPVLGSLGIGLYVWLLNYKQHKSLQQALRYAPSGEYKVMFEDIIRACNVDPATIVLRYAYTAQQIAMTVGNTIIMDPTSCSICNQDQGARSVINVFTNMYESNLNVLGKERQLLQSNLTPEVQSFIFKHELGHVVDQFSYKKLWIIFAIGFLAAFSAVMTMKLLWSCADTDVVHLLAGFVGLVVGMLVDFILSYASNFFFKVAQEKRADEFAAKYSTYQEIIQAAHFFAQEQEIIEKYKDPNNWFLKLPVTIISGHPDGKTREAYLLQLALQKKG